MTLNIFDLAEYNPSVMDLKISDRATRQLVPSEIVKELDKYVVGQHKAKRLLATVIANHRAIAAYNDTNPKMKLKRSNILLAGPSGCGKTFLVETLGRILNIPVHTVDITHYTQAGYVGKDVEGIMGELFESAPSEEAAKRAIIFVDEIDKVATYENTAAIGSTGVQRELLRLVDGGKQNFVFGKGMSKESVEIDTSNILWIFGGAFTNFIKKKKDKATKKSLGFDNAKQDEKPFELDHEALIEAGLYRELVGRIGHVAVIEELNKADYIKILTDTDECVANQYKQLGLLRGIDLSLTKKEIEEIADEAMKLKVGARGLKILAEKKLFDRSYI